MDKRQKQIVRGFLAVASALLTLGCIVAVLYLSAIVDFDAGIPNLPWNDATSKGIDLQLDLSQTLFQMALLTTGALWGLVIAKKDETRLVLSNPNAEVVMFVSASLALLLSIFSYGIYLSGISHDFADAGAASNPDVAPLSVPDIFDQNINYVFHWQIISLVAGIFGALCTLISSHRLKE